MWVLSGDSHDFVVLLFLFISPSSPFPIFLCRMAVARRGRRRIRTAMALLQTVIYGRPAVCSVHMRSKTTLAKTCSLGGAEQSVLSSGLRMFYPTLPFCTIPG